MTPAVRNIVLSNRVAWSFMGDGSRVWDFTRASDGTRVNPAGSWETIGTNGLRYDYDPTTGSLRGVLVEPARTNSVRNSIVAGSSAGTPGTLPTNWSTDLPGLTRTVVGTGTTNGIDYVDITVSGVTSALYGLIAVETNTGIAASNGQSWAESIFMALSGGSFTNVGTVRLTFAQYSAAVAFLSNVSGSDVKAGISSSMNRFSSVLTVNNASTASIHPFILFSWSSGVSVNFTIRLGWAQDERIDSGISGATSPLRTTGSAATRAVDTLSLPVPPGAYSVAAVGGTVLQAGTTYTDTVTVTGTAWDFAWPTAAITAGERHLQRVSMRRIG